MFIRLFSVMVEPDKLEEVRALNNSDQVGGVLTTQKGFHFRYLLESVDNPGELISLTGWDSKTDGDAYEHSGTFDELKGKFKQWFTSTPELKSYEVTSSLVQSKD